MWDIQGKIAFHVSISQNSMCGVRVGGTGEIVSNTSLQLVRFLQTNLSDISVKITYDTLRCEKQFMV
jgi:hypothetical protein